MSGRRLGSTTILTHFFLALALVSSAQAGAKFKVLHAFGVGKDGAGLYGSLAVDSEGSLYGTTSGGGQYGDGTVFELRPQRDGKWTETMIHSFNCKERVGCIPAAGLVFDAAGSLYGKTSTHVFELKPSSGGWALSVLYDHGGPSNLLLDHAQNLYAPMGPGEYGLGAVNELVRSKGWKETSLYSFCPKRPCVDGWSPFAGVTWGPAGSLYGTTLIWRRLAATAAISAAALCYQLTPDETGSWKETVLHSFPAFKGDGFRSCMSGVILDKSGNVYGIDLPGRQHRLRGDFQADSES